MNHVRRALRHAELVAGICVLILALTAFDGWWAILGGMLGGFLVSDGLDSLTSRGQP